MNPPGPHVIDELQLRLDNRLDTQDVARVTAHLATCSVCRQAAAELEAVSQAVGRLADSNVPSGLAARVGRVLDGEAAVAPRARRAWGIAAVGFGAAAVLALAVWLATPETLPAAASAEVARVGSGTVRLDVATPAPGVLEQHFRDRGLPVRVLDLAMMDLTLEGGAVRTLAGRPAALYVYRRPDGTLVVCQMFDGRLEELPTPDASLDSGGFRFHVYRYGRRTLVFWAEGGTLCVLAADLPEDEVVALARAKAMKPA